MYTKVKGTIDFLPEQSKKLTSLENYLKDVASLYGYQEIRVPILSYSELIHRSSGESSDIVTKETFDFKDRGDRMVTLRPEGTAPVVRAVLENKLYTSNLPLKLFYSGPMFRYERPQKGRYREFSQFGVEVVGSNSPYMDAEVITLATTIFKSLRIKNFRVRLNTLGDDDSRNNYKVALKEYFKDKLDLLCNDCKKRYETNTLRILDCKIDKDNEVLLNAPKISDYLSDKSKEEFEVVKSYLDLLHIPYIVDDYHADPTTLLAAILHDVIEDTSKTFDDIKNNFGMEVANLVEGLTKIRKMTYTDTTSLKRSDENEYASNFQKMLFSMVRDIRVIWIKLSDRLNNMLTLKYLPYEKQIRISKETQAIYAPIAHKLGMYQIKAELEDLSFKYLYPQEYEEISKKLKTTKKAREADLNKMATDIHDLLKSEGIEADISKRVKNINSIYNKMEKKGIPFENIYDLQALRAIVKTVIDCYKAIGIIHSKYAPVPSRFKDYIAVPKPNMYQSLHTTVVNDGKIYEIQIRTKEMDEIAENGIAAHWAYKEGVKLKSS